MSRFDRELIRGWLGLVMIKAAMAMATAVMMAVVQLGHSAAAGLIEAAGLTWTSSGNCDDRNNASCTSFEGIRQTTIDGIITLKRASGCPITITGGTEAGHGAGGMFTHWDGWKLDIAHNDCVDSYIRNGFAHIGWVRGWGDQYQSPAGNLYTDEGNHWDIIYYNCGGCADPTPSATPSVAPSESPSPAPSPVPARVKRMRYLG